MKIVPVPKHAAPVGAQLTWLPAPAGCDFTKPLPVAKVATERGVNQYTVAIELESGDLEAIQRAGGRFTITFFGSAPLFILDTIDAVVAAGSEPGSSGSGSTGTTEPAADAMEGPYSARFPSPREKTGPMHASVVPASRSG